MGHHDMNVPGLAGSAMMKVITKREAGIKKAGTFGSSKFSDKKKPSAPKRKGGRSRKDDSS